VIRKEASIDSKGKGKIVSPILSSSLLTATMILGQTGEPPPLSGQSVAPAGPTVQQTQPMQRPILGWFGREDRPVLHRLQAWFKRDQPEGQPQGKSMSPSRGGVIREPEKPRLLDPVPSPVPPLDFPRKMPNPQSKTPAAAPEVQPASLQPAARAQSMKNPILPQHAKRVGRDEKFDWITGQIEIENASYVMYYATPETIDKYHGRIVLAPQKVDLSQFRRGDLVSVRGQLVQRPTTQGMIPTYRVSVASLIDRPKS
jgi:hypothetical protein